MKYVRLGSTGMEVSRIALGCGNFGGVGSAPEFYGKGENDAQATELMDRAWNAGVNLFDTADAYGGGRSEAFIGRWLTGKGSAVRDQLVVSSKVFNPVGPGPNRRGLSRKHIFQQIDASLTRLNTDRLDLYLMHEPDPATPIDETIDAMTDLVRAGKVVYIGASNIEAWGLANALGRSDARSAARFACVQNSYSLLDRGQEREMFPLCAERGVGFSAFSPLAGGWLTGKYRANTPYPTGSRMTLRPEPYAHLPSGRVFSGLAALHAMAELRGVEVSTLALAWVLRQPHVHTAIAGPRRPAHLDAALAALDVQLSDEEAGAIAGVFTSGKSFSP